MFDIIIQNPPYQRSLHLKILQKTLQYLNPGGKLVNLSPIRWLLDPLGPYKNNTDYKRFESTVSCHIREIDVIPKRTAVILFNAGICNALGIYTCTKDSGTEYKSLFKNPIVEMFVKHLANHNPVIDKDKYLGWRVRIPLIISKGQCRRRKTRDS